MVYKTCLLVFKRETQTHLSLLPSLSNFSKLNHNSSMATHPTLNLILDNLSMVKAAMIALDGVKALLIIITQTILKVDPLTNMDVALVHHIDMTAVILAAHHQISEKVGTNLCHHEVEILVGNLEVDMNDLAQEVVLDLLLLHAMGVHRHLAQGKTTLLLLWIYHLAPIAFLATQMNLFHLIQ